MNPPETNTTEIIDTFRDFYHERGHRSITGSTLLPGPGDPVLFTTSGMHPLTPYLEGHPHPLGNRLVNVQRCLRTTDLEEVGDPWHLTVFEMLGTWSLGDYDGPQSLRWGFELLTDVLGVDPSRLHSTVFGGDRQVPPDDESRRTWGELGLPVELTVSDNWWSNGPTGPCGPDSEVFFWTGDGEPLGSPSTDPRWVEIWNHVTMRYRRHDDGSLTPLPQQNVDTGMGLERLLSVLHGTSSVYERDLFEPWRRDVDRLWEVDETGRRLLCDHLRSMVVVVGDGVLPSNTGRGYVLRRLVRRVLTTLWRIDPTYTLHDVSGEPIDHTIDHFGLGCKETEVRRVLLDEERRFRDLVTRGRRVVSKELSKGPLDEGRLRDLHETHGLPRELVLGLVTDLGGEGELVR
jgi:alanyl-tRNA synthetase